MATLQKNRSGTWRAIVRRKGLRRERTFSRKIDAEAWASETELAIIRGDAHPNAKLDQSLKVEALIDQHIEDMCEVGKAPGRSKAYSLDKLRDRIGSVAPTDISREFLIDFAKKRHREGAGPVTISMDIGYLKTILDHAISIHGYNISTESFRHARIALRRLGLVAKSEERNRRPTEDEIARLCQYFDDKPRQQIPVGRLIRFGIATAMRQDEICRISWTDLDEVNGTIKIRERKDPRRKKTNDQIVPLVTLTGYDPVALMKEDLGTHRSPIGRIFPYNAKSLSTAFTRACTALGIEDLHFHDLRHEATSRLFEAGLDIPRVARITGHKDWKQLQRYTHLQPSQLAAEYKQAKQSRCGTAPRVSTFYRRR